MSNLKYYLDDDVRELLESKSFDFNSFDVNIEKPEIDVESIAKDLGCSIEYSYLVSKAGSHDYETSLITVNKFDPHYRQRFTIAHEIAHNVYNHSGIRNRVTHDQDLDEKDKSYVDILIERQANDFASKLLMPKKLLLEVKNNLIEINEIQNKKQEIVKLAEKFNVSYIAMEYRLEAVK